jgi:hypothetical protein
MDSKYGKFCVFSLLELTEANVDMRLGYVDGYDKTQKNKRSTNYLTYFRTL